MFRKSLLFVVGWWLQPVLDQVSCEGSRVRHGSVPSAHILSGQSTSHGGRVLWEGVRRGCVLGRKRKNDSDDRGRLNLAKRVGVTASFCGDRPNGAKVRFDFSELPSPFGSVILPFSPHSPHPWPNPSFRRHRNTQQQSRYPTLTPHYITPKQLQTSTKLVTPSLSLLLFSMFLWSNV